MKNKKIFICILVSLFMFTLIGCKEDTKDKIIITASLFPQYDMARSIAGEYGDVKMLLLPGQDSHSYDPLVDDILRIKQSDLFIYTGDMMETWVKEIIDTLQSNVKIVDISENGGIKLKEIEEPDEEGHEDHEGHDHDVDPHLWTNPLFAIEMVRSIRDGLIKVDSTHRDYYSDNAQKYIDELTSIDNSILEIVNQSTTKKMYFACPMAFSYFLDRYGLSYMSLYSTCSTEVDPTVNDILAMNKEIKENNIQAVYVKELLSTEVAKKVVENTSAKILLLHSGHNVSLDDFNKGITFIDIWKNNIESIREGLK